MLRDAHNDYTTVAGFMAGIAAAAAVRGLIARTSAATWIPYLAMDAIAVATARGLAHALPTTGLSEGARLASWWPMFSLAGRLGLFGPQAQRLNGWASPQSIAEALTDNAVARGRLSIVVE